MLLRSTPASTRRTQARRCRAPRSSRAQWRSRAAIASRRRTLLEPRSTRRPRCPSRSLAGSPRAAGTPRAHQLELLAKAQRRPLGPADRADRRRQDAGRLPAEPDRAGASGHRRDSRARARPAHPLHLAAEGAGRRRRAQPRTRRSPRWACRSASRPAPATRRRRKRQRQRRDPPDILLTTPEQLALLLAAPRRAAICSATCAASCSTSCTRWSPPSAATCCRSASRGCIALAPQLTSDRPVGDGRRARRAAPLPGAAAAGRRSAAPTSSSREGGAAPDVAMLDTERASALGRPHGAPRASPRSTSSIKRAQDHAGLRQHPHARPSCSSRSCGGINDDNLPIALHHGSLDVGAAPQGRGGDGGGRAARRGLHLDARPRHRLGRRRSRHPSRRAEGRAPAGAAHRPRQPPPGRAVARRSSCRPTASRCWNARPPSRRSPRTRRTAPPLRTGALDVLAQHVLGMRLRRAVRSPTSSTTRCAAPRPMRDLTREDFDARRRFRRHRRLRAASLRALRQDPRRARTAAGASRNPRIAQHYRLNVGTIVEADMLKVRLVARRAASRGTVDRARRPRARRDRGRFRRDADAGRHLRLRRRGPALRGHRARTRSIVSRATPAPTRRCRPRAAASSRSRPISPTRVREMLADPSAWRGLPDQVRDWLELQTRALASCPAPRRAAGRDLPARRQRTTSSAIRSRAGSRTRRSACC